MSTPHTILGVDGTLENVRHYDNGLCSNQRWHASRPIDGYGSAGTLTVYVRFDDCCKNGHQTFSIIEAGGCLHEDIARIFPELAPLIQWHLMSTDGPMHYLANTVYRAGDRDYNGLRKGETRHLRNGKTGLPVWRLVTRGSDSEDIPTTMHAETADELPPVFAQWEPVLIQGIGKNRELNAARNAAVWPDATDAELSVEPDELRAALVSRLPGLIERFKRAMTEDCGFAWN
jgi:uncharacterized protein Usg